MNPLIRKQFDYLENQLSPENLCGDGEYTRTQTIRRYKAIMVQWRKLEKQIGMKVNPEV